ncbi:hypothetical protein PAXINDRAFT_91492 [Paxillus involutus ATCC 200175]|uniref:Unplaced genomic scaffold PAXINscaffold_843, whole genome shotgun sequence n=1 Tax=Paxillus involutus ATCC 200175 TaxID=664439 RepID=A0A0C9THG9_PAXIN|nr:hypothetical protein PAXINDRAFT_91492 [Paxillus involutus ATCC 200175]
MDSDSVPFPVPPALYRRHNDPIISGQYHPSSGFIYGRGETLLDKLKADENERRRKHAMYYPFRDDGEWDLGKFLAKHLTLSAINEFLQLKWVNREKPSFKSAEQLVGWIDALPGSPSWQCTTLELPPYKSERPIRLIWRDAREVVQDIVSNPMFANYMTFDPHVVLRGAEREYSEFFTGDRAHHIQVDQLFTHDQLIEGATIIPIIIGSDKTPVTKHTGGLEMHPVFVTVGNIQSDVRMQATSHAWRCVAFMPIPSFDVHPDFQTLLVSRVFHRCMDIVFGSLKQSAQTGYFMTDGLGCIRNCFTPLADPWDIKKFQKQAKLVKLLGVHQPFWRDWKFADPAFFLNGEILHTCHKFFFDHILKWCKEVAGNYLLDTRYKTQHKRIAVRHFGSGVSHIKQMTGREHRDIQRTIVPMIAGAGANSTPLFVYSIRSMIEFIYQAQNPTHTNSSLASMVGALKEFHATKQAVVDAEGRRGAKGVRDDFNIPKLELMQSFARNITNNGTLMQYTADVTERLLITHCKLPFERTSRQAATFVDQIVAILNREESMRRFDLYHILRLSQAPLENAVLQEDEEVTTIDPALSFISRVAPEQEHSFKGPRPFRNHFANPKGFHSSDGAIAFHVTVQPDHTGILVVEMQRDYNLPHAMQYIVDYINSASGGTPTSLWSPTTGKVDLWYKFRIQLQSSFRSRYLTKSQAIQAYPCSPERPFGTYDAVLLIRPNAADIFGKFVYLGSS